MRFIITAQPGKDTKPPDPDAPLDEKLFSDYMNSTRRCTRPACWSRPKD